MENLIICGLGVRVPQETTLESLQALADCRVVYSDLEDKKGRAWLASYCKALKSPSSAAEISKDAAKGGVGLAVWGNPQSSSRLARAVVIDDFTQQSPKTGDAPTEQTQIYLLYDHDALYVGARMRRAKPNDMSRSMTRRDGFGNAERIVVTLDPQRDRRTGVGFGVSVAGVRSDFRHTQDDQHRE